MLALTAPLQLMPWRGNKLELRIDVRQPAHQLDTELDTLHQRLNTRGDTLHGLPETDAPIPGFVFRYREADGEYYVYVEDVVRRCLAGYTVFNRLIEVDRRADRHLRAPHSKYAPDYQRCGLASAVYERALGSGLSLMSGARQSPGAHALWHRLARRHELGYVQVQDKVIRYLGREVEQPVLDALHTRMILLGNDWTIESLAARTGMRDAPRQAQP